MVREHDVLIVGAGNAGISLAARLRRDGCRDVALVEPSPVHRYRPLQSYVGGGQATPAEVERPQASVLPADATWYRGAVAAVDPQAREVRLEDGTRLRGRDLVLCPGVVADWDAVPGSREAVHAEHGASNYVDERAAHTWALTRGLRAGRAVFAVGAGVVPCAGAALKPAFLSTDHWRRAGLLGSIEVTLLVPWPTVFGIDAVDAALLEAAADLGITVRTGARLERIDPAARSLVLADGDTLDYDLLHLAPTHRGHAWVEESGLAAPLDPADPFTGEAMVEVDPRTLAHPRHVGVWALGDAAQARASRSGGALREQVPVVAENIRRTRLGEPLIGYDGYSTAPITTGRHELVLAEFDRDLRPRPSVPFPDLARRRRSTWAYDRWLQPQLYWHGILRGRVRA